MSINYTHHYADKGVILSNGEGLLVQLLNSPNYCHLSDYVVTDFTHELSSGRQLISFSVQSSGVCRWINSEREALKLIDPLGGMTVEQLLHAAQQRMQLREDP